jgi:phosphoglycerate dehydrogenase-like enzyme
VKRLKLLIATDARFSPTPALIYELSELCSGYDVVSKAAASLSQCDTADASILLGAPNPDLLNTMPHLEWLHLTTPCFEPYADLQRYANTRITVTKSPFGNHAAEFVLASLLAVAQGLTDRRSEDFEPVRLSGTEVLLTGLGDLGQAIAEKLHDNGCRVLALRSNVLEKPKTVSWVGTLRQLHEVAGCVRFSINCLPLTNETKHFWNADAFRLLRPGGIFVHAGHSGTVDDFALADSICRGGLYGAAYDGFLPDGHPLAARENTLITPALAACAHEHNLRDIIDRFILMYKMYTEKKLLPNQIQFYRGY